MRSGGLGDPRNNGESKGVRSWAEGVGQAIPFVR